MSSSTTYPPSANPSRRDRQSPSDESSSTPTSNESPLNPSSSSSSLYDRSPHRAEDQLWRRRRARASCGLDPLHVVALILIVALLLGQLNLFSPFSTSPSSVVRKRKAAAATACSCCCDSAPSSKMVWQKTFTLPSASKGCHLITPSVEREIAEGLKGVKAGLITLFIQHTSAALSVNENFDSTVRTDMNMAMDKIVPESLPWKHTDEGPDDSASHTKASLFGSSITIPITDGRLNLGTWQGIYLCEFRAMKHSRRIVATVLP